MSDARDDEDRRLILSRRELLIASALSGASVVGVRAAAQGPEPCLAPPRPSGSVHFSAAPGRHLTPPERIPAVVRDHLRPESIYAAGGGLTSTPWRIVLDLNGALRAAAGDQPGGASFGALPITWGARLSALELRSVVAIADRAWREARAPSLHPTADYDEVLAMRELSEHFFVQGFGPLRGGAAGELVAALRRIADAARPPAP